jgi:hypothetical protein
LFKQKSPANIILLLIFGLFIKIPLFLYPKHILATDRDGALYHGFISMITPPGGSNAWLAATFSFFLLYIQAMMLNYMLNEYRLTSRQNYLPAMAYLLLTSLLPEWNYLSSPLLSATFVIWMFICIFRLYNIAGAKGPVFNIGLIAGISSFIFFPSTLFIVSILLGLMVLKPFRLNEILLFIMGILSPYYFYALYLFLTDQFHIQDLFPRFTFSAPDVKNSIWLAASVTLVTVLFLMGGYFIQVHLRKMLIQARKYWSVVLFYLLVSLFVPFVNNAETLTTWVLAAAPFAAFHSFAYFHSKGWIALLLFLIVVGFILYSQYGTPAWR